MQALQTVQRAAGQAATLSAGVRWNLAAGNDPRRRRRGECGEAGPRGAVLTLTRRS